MCSVWCVLMLFCFRCDVYDLSDVFVKRLYDILKCSVWCVWCSPVVSVICISVLCSCSNWYDFRLCSVWCALMLLCFLCEVYASILFVLFNFESCSVVFYVMCADVLMCSLWLVWISDVCCSNLYDVIMCAVRFVWCYYVWSVMCMNVLCLVVQICIMLISCLCSLYLS